jgi:hypothetical protein
MQCESLLNTWHSKIGKAGHHAVADLWHLDPSLKISTEAHANYATESLGEFCFVYKEPDAYVSAKTVPS